MHKMRQGDEFQTSFYFLKKLDMRWKQKVCSLVSIYFDSSIALNLPSNKNKLYKTLDYWSRDMLNFNFSEKGLELAGTSISPQFVHDFWKKIFVTLHSVNWSSFIVGCRGGIFEKKNPSNSFNYYKRMT